MECGGKEEGLSVSQQRASICFHHPILCGLGSVPQILLYFVKRTVIFVSSGHWKVGDNGPDQQAGSSTPLTPLLQTADPFRLSDLG